MSHARAAVEASTCSHPDSLWPRDRMRDWKFVVTVWALSRLWVALCVYAGHASHPFRKVEAGAFEGVSAWWLNPWTVFDSKYFLHIARAGYSGEGAPEAAGFFPLYPALLQPLAHDENAAAALGIVLSNAFLLAACWILLRLTQREYAVRHGGAGTQADGVARRAVFGLAFFPVSAYFSAVYSESLFLLCSVCLFWCARRDKWAWVAAWGLAAGATRNGGPLLSLALLAVVASQCRAQVLAPRARRNLAAPIVASLVPLATLLVIQRGLAERVGGVLPSAQAQGRFGRAWDWPWAPLRDEVLHLARDPDMVAALNLSAVLAAAILAFWTLRAHWRGETLRPALYGPILYGGVTLANLIAARQGAPHTNSTLRYLLCAFPFAQALALYSWRLAAPNAERDAPARLFDRARLLAVILVLLCGVFSFAFGRRWFLG